MTARHPLPDGSVAVVEPRGRFVLLSREVDGECVWGQAGRLEEHDSRGRPDPRAPHRHLIELLRGMEADPAAYCRWWKAAS